MPQGMSPGLQEQASSVRPFFVPGAPGFDPQFAAYYRVLEQQGAVAPMMVPPMYGLENGKPMMQPERVSHEPGASAAESWRPQFAGWRVSII